MARIYISSTYSDLVEHRQKVYDILRRIGYDVIAMEDFIATDRRPLDKCLDAVASCDIYVGIFARRYGYIPHDQEQSITELEYRRAGELGLERLIFLLDDDAPWPHRNTEKGMGGERIEALRRELTIAHTVQFFKSPEELAGQVAASVAAWTQLQLNATIDSLRARSELHPVFQGQDFCVDENLCFVLMPFGPKKLQDVYHDHIKPVVERCGLRCERSDDIYSSGVVVEDIWTGINRARLIIAELTGRNPNVFYEIGLCHVLGKDVIFLAQDIKDVPFDLQHFRVILYEYTPPGASQLEEALERTIKAHLQ